MSETPRFFDVIAVFDNELNRRYRVYVLPDKLIFVWVASGGELPVLLKLFGVIGWFLSSLVSHKRKTAQRIIELEELPIEALSNEHPNNFCLTPADVLQARIECANFMTAFNYITPGLIGMLRIQNLAGHELKLGFLSYDDMKTAIETLPNLLDNRFHISVTWDTDRERFVPR